MRDSSLAEARLISSFRRSSRVCNQDHRVARGHGAAGIYDLPISNSDRLNEERLRHHELSDGVVDLYEVKQP
jgi:hypothetical protein